MSSGKVYLVGAGPGDPGLLTAKARRCLQQADLVLYDPAVGRSLLAEIPPGTVSQAAGDGRLETIRSQAEAGRIVCLLLPGDGVLSGAAAKVSLGLAERGVPVEMVPGVSAVAGAVGYAGVLPAEPGGSEPMTWVGRDGALMGQVDAPGLAHLVSDLLADGTPENTPVVLVSGATTAAQQTVGATLKTVVQEASQAALPFPAVAVLGAQVRSEAKLDWFWKQPLFGKRVLITRARHQAGAMAREVQALGGEPWQFPVIAVVEPESWDHLDQAIGAIHRYQWLVITSVNGAEHFFARLMAAGKDVRSMAHLKVAAVGSVTARALRSRGLNPDVIPENFRGAALPAAMEPLLAAGDRVLMARGNLANPALAQRLEALGAEVDDIVTYCTVPAPGDPQPLLQALARGEIHYAAFTSPSTVKNLIAKLGGTAPLAGVRIACIGPDTREAAEAAGLPVHVMPARYTVPDLVQALGADCTGC